jgi:hypothetical protein
MWANLLQLDYTACAWLSVVLVCIGVVIDTLEYLVVAPHYASTGIYSGRIIRTRYGYTQARALRGLHDRLFSDTAFKLLLIVRLTFVGLLFVPVGSDYYYAACLTVILFTGFFTSFRSIYGGDGSNQMQTVVIAGVIGFLLIDPSSGLKMLGVWFIVLQSCLSYSASGWSKLLSRTWRSGAAVFLIFNTATYGLRPVAKFLKGRKYLQIFLSWSVMIFEVIFPVVLFLPPKGALLLLFVGLTFHLGNALIMGLNTFFWSFFATYPLVMVINKDLRGYLFG